VGTGPVAGEMGEEQKIKICIFFFFRKNGIFKIKAGFVGSLSDCS
jgi:hypothetical protein